MTVSPNALQILAFACANHLERISGVFQKPSFNLLQLWNVVRLDGLVQFSSRLCGKFVSLLPEFSNLSIKSYATDVHVKITAALKRWDRKA